MEMKNFYYLNFRERLEVKFLEKFNNQTESWILNKVPIHHFTNTHLFEYFKEIQFVPFNHVNFFTGHAYESTVIHSDLSYGNKDTVYALNYIWGADETLTSMSWYKVKPDSTFKVGNTTANTPYYYYLDEDVIEIEKKQDLYHQLVLVRIDTPHRVVNNCNSNRYCLSFRGGPTLSWEGIVKYFEPYFL